MNITSRKNGNFRQGVFKWHVKLKRVKLTGYEQFGTSPKVYRFTVPGEGDREYSVLLTRKELQGMLAEIDSPEKRRLNVSRM